MQLTHQLVPPSASLASLQVVHSEDNTAAAGEWPHSAYACGMYGGLWQHGEAHHIVFSDEHASVTNEVSVGGCGSLQLAVVGWLADATACSLTSMPW